MIYTGRDNIRHIVTISNLTTNVELGESPYISITFKNGNVRDTVPENLSRPPKSESESLIPPGVKVTEEAHRRRMERIMRDEARLERQRVAEVERQRVVEVERQRVAEVERQRVVEVERQRVVKKRSDIRKNFIFRLKSYKHESIPELIKALEEREEKNEIDFNLINLLRHINSVRFNKSIGFLHNFDQTKPSPTFDRYLDEYL